MSVYHPDQWMSSRRVWEALRYLDYTDFTTQNLERPEFSQILEREGVLPNGFYPASTQNK